jgi:ribonuclease Z
MLHHWNCERPDVLRGVKLAGFSGALSHFAYLGTRGVLFDLGEGVASRLEPELFGRVEVFLSHVHDDHLLGLRGFALMRSVLHRDPDHRPTVYVPEPALESVAADLTGFASLSGFDWHAGIELQTISTGQTVLLHNRHYVEVFDADHLPGGASLGFRLIERRKRLQERWRHLETFEVAMLRKRLPAEEVIEDFDVAEFVYSGDTPLCPAPFARGAKILWHEATFLDHAHRNLEAGRHAVLGDVVALAKEAEAESLVLTHVSRRYREADVCAAIEAALKATGYDRPTFWLRGSFDLPVD